MINGGAMMSIRSMTISHAYAGLRKFSAEVLWWYTQVLLTQVSPSVCASRPATRSHLAPLKRGRKRTRATRLARDSAPIPRA